MSASIQIFLNDSRIPTVDQWNAAIKAEGFDLVLDQFDLRKDSAYRPASLGNEESGFEWYLSPITYFDESPDSPLKAQIGDCDLQASMCFGSRGVEATAASIAGAVLAKLAGGFYLNCESDALLRRDDAIAAARRGLQEWQELSKNPAKHIASAITSVMAAALKPLGFVRATPRNFARMNDGVVQCILIDKRDADFRGAWTGLALYPLRDCLSLHFTPLDSRIDNWHKVETQSQANTDMQELAEAFLKHVYPWFEETKTDSAHLDYLMEFDFISHHNLFNIASLQARLGRTDEAISNLKEAIFQYEEDGRSWCPAYIALCQELLDAIHAGTSLGLLENWRIQSLQNLGLKKLLQEPRKTGNKSSLVHTKTDTNSPTVPLVIPAGTLRTAAAFSREAVRPSIVTMMECGMPDFHPVEVRGPDSIFMREGTDGLFDFVIFTRNWSGALAVRLASHYDSNWRGNLNTELGCSIGLANLHLGLNERQLNSSHAASLQRWYRYRRSDAELSEQLVLVKKHLAEHAPPFFIAARNIMQSKKIVQFGLSQVIKNPLTEAEKLQLKKEVGIALCDHKRAATNAHYLELVEKLTPVIGPQLEVPPEERYNTHSLAEELLQANLSPHAVQPEKTDRKGSFWNPFRKR